MKTFFFFGLIFVLFGCNGGGGGSSGGGSISSSLRSISGVVVDGYIQGSSVCLDINVNSRCDGNEPVTQTNERGEFSFTNPTLGTSTLIPVIAKGGIDTATSQAFLGELKKIINVEDTASGSHALTPLTDLSATHFLESESKDVLSLNLANYIVSTVLQIPMSDLEKNPMSDAVIFTKAQEIENLKSLVETSALKAITGETDEEKDEIRKKIKSSIVSQLETDFFFGRDLIDVEGVINETKENLRVDYPSFDIPDNEKNFIKGQITEIKASLEIIKLIGDTSTLDELQARLVSEVELAHSAILGASGGLIPVVAISDDLVVEIDDEEPSEPTPSEPTPNPTPTPTPPAPVESTPVADAGASFSTLSKNIRLDGSKSSDPAGGSLSYSWSVALKPEGSAVTFNSSTLSSPTASVDKFGLYVFTLTVSNGTRSASNNVAVTVQKMVEYTEGIPENGVGMISDHLTKEGYSSYVNGHLYDTSDYMSLSTTKINTNGVRVEKINISSTSTESLANYDTTNPIYRMCISASTCYRGFTHKTDKDKLLVERLDHVNKTASEHILTSKAIGTESYIQKSNWNIQFKNNALYVFRKLFVSFDANISNYGPFDVELMKFNTSFERQWSTVIKTSSYGTGANTVVSKDAYSPYYTTWLTLESYAGKLVLHNYISGGRSGAEKILIDEADGSVDDVVNYFIYENNQKKSTESHYPNLAKNGKLYFSDYYDFYSGTRFSTTNGVIFYHIDSSFNPSRATVVTSLDPNLYFLKSSMASEDDVIYLSINRKTDGSRDLTKKGYLYFTNLSVDGISLHHDLLDEHFSESAEALTAGRSNVRIGGEYFTNHIAYSDVFNTKASSVTSIGGINRNFFSVRYGSGLLGSSSIELDEFGLHPGCFQASASSSNITSFPYSVKDLEVRKFSYETPITFNRTVSVTSFQRGVTSEEIEERAPWLCSSYAMNLDVKVRVVPNGTVTSHAHDRGHYRYTLLSAPTKGTVTIHQPGNFTITGNTIVQFKANAGAQGTDSYRLLATDGTGSKVVTVSVEIK